MINYKILGSFQCTVLLHGKCREAENDRKRDVDRKGEEGKSEHEVEGWLAGGSWGRLC